MSIQIILTASLIALGIAVLMAFLRAVLGPTAFDRALAVNSIGTIAVLAICVHGYWAGRPEFLDIALLYALINFIGTIAVLKFFRFGTLGDHLSSEHAIGHPSEDDQKSEKK